MKKIDRRVGSLTLMDREADISEKPFVSVILPAYNEASIIKKNLDVVYDYMKSLRSEYRWEIIVVNDGSADDTGVLADSFAVNKDNVRVLHHFVNFRLGQALRYAFNNCHGDYLVVMDMDLSYSPEHIGRLLETIRETRAKVVIASPYMKGGEASNIPWLRKKLSVWANKFLSVAAKGNLSTYTGMVRAYDRKFIQTLSLRSMDMSINAEIIYKAMLLNARIVEIPARLDWSSQEAKGVGRTSSMKIGKSIFAYLLSGFMFRPFIFFILPGFMIMSLSLYSFFWAIVHTISFFNKLQGSFGPFDVRLSAAVASAFQQSPHTFIIGGISLMLAIQLISLGILSLQSKNNFEDMYQLCTDMYKASKENR
jgi:glycosyltransferase involved in cell wall biosynthesis